jgi:hypothetical protein
MEQSLLSLISLGSFIAQDRERLTFLGIHQVLVIVVVVCVLVRVLVVGRHAAMYSEGKGGGCAR